MERGVVVMSNWTPAIEVESARGTREVKLRTEHLKERRVFLTGDIEEGMAEDIISQLLYCRALGSGVEESAEY